jgi:hypothetical protein
VLSEHLRPFLSLSFDLFFFFFDSGRILKTKFFNNKSIILDISVFINITFWWYNNFSHTKLVTDHLYRAPRWLSILQYKLAHSTNCNSSFKKSSNCLFYKKKIFFYQSSFYKLRDDINDDNSNVACSYNYYNTNF